MPNIKKFFKDKFIPKQDREYIVTDQCMWEADVPTDYNPFDPKRKPHAISLVDKETGTIVNLESGSIIKIVKAK